MKILVTGGSGLIGSCLKELAPEWIYLSSHDCDLLDISQVNKILKKYNPDIIIHLAANVGGLFKNTNNRLNMFNSNLIMNYNLLDTAYKLGIKRVICCLSTCIFPDNLKILTESDLHSGEPHFSNFGYAYAKRIMEVQCRLYNETKDINYQCIIPTNIYGPFDNFNLDDSHVIPGLIHKAYLHSLEDKNKPFKILGTGKPIRQFIYSYDVAKIIVKLIDEEIKEKLIILSPPEKDEITIFNLAKKISLNFDISQVITSEKHEINEQDGQQCKRCNPSKLLSIFPDFQFTSLDDGLNKTINWFKINYPNIRK